MPNGYILKRSGSYLCNPPFLIFGYSGAREWAP